MQFIKAGMGLLGLLLGLLSLASGQLCRRLTIDDLGSTTTPSQEGNLLMTDTELHYV